MILVNLIYDRETDDNNFQIIMECTEENVNKFTKQTIKESLLDLNQKDLVNIPIFYY